tara:strand:- start:4529 stop:4834 length:306 start_codon:yes stop_codon:yes gene_type:complete
MKYAQLKKSSISGKKYTLLFFDKDRKKVKTIHFGQAGADDYTKTGDKEQRDRYRNRHNNSRENHNVPDTPASASRWILWGDSTSVSANYNSYLKRFGLSKY